MGIDVIVQRQDIEGENKGHATSSTEARHSVKAEFSLYSGIQGGCLFSHILVPCGPESSITFIKTSAPLRLIYFNYNMLQTSSHTS